MRIGLAGSDQTRSGGSGPRAVRGEAVEQVTVTVAGSEVAAIAAAHRKVAPAMVGFQRPFEPVGGRLGRQGS